LDSLCRLREGPVTRLSNSYLEKDEKPKSELNPDDDHSQESEKVENNDNSENDENDVSAYYLVFSFFK
jgi:hypothetical protein